MKFNSKLSSKSNPAVRLVTEKPQAPMRLSGLAPAPEMQAGEYLAHCKNAFVERSKNRAVLDFVVIDGEHSGVALPMWVNGVNNAIRPTSRYAKECTIALGRELTADDDLDPGAIFKGKHFAVQVGWRMTDKPGGGTAKDEFAMHKKDGRDFLRVHRILREVEL